MSLLLAFLGGFCGGLVAHFIWTSGLLALIEVRMMRARAAAAKIWINERGALKDELAQLKIRFLTLEKQVTGKPAKGKR